MNRKQYEVGSLPEEIVIGRQTETGVMAIRIDCTGWLTFWPGLALSIWATPPGGSAAYPAKTHMEGTVLVWDVNNSDTAVSGVGTMEIVGIASGKKKLSAIAKTRVERTTTIGTSTPPEAAKAWVDDVMRAAGDAESSKNQASSYAKSAEESAKKAAESAASASVSWENLTGKPSTFPPATHGHAMAEVDGLPDALGELKNDLTDEQTSRANADQALANDIGDAWASGTTYAAGDYCISGNQLYKCKTAHTAGSAFSSDYWDTTTIAREIKISAGVTPKLSYGRIPNGASSFTINITAPKTHIGSYKPFLLVIGQNVYTFSMAFSDTNNFYGQPSEVTISHDASSTEITVTKNSGLFGDYLCYMLIYTL